MLPRLAFSLSASPVNTNGNTITALQVPWVHPTVLFHAEAVNQP